MIAILPGEPSGREPLYFAAFRRILGMHTRLSAWFAVGLPAGGEMSGLTAHFLFGRVFCRPHRPLFPGESGRSIGLGADFKQVVSDGS